MARFIQAVGGVFQDMGFVPQMRGFIQFMLTQERVIKVTDTGRVQ